MDIGNHARFSLRPNELENAHRKAAFCQRLGWIYFLVGQDAGAIFEEREEQRQKELREDLDRRLQTYRETHPECVLSIELSNPEVKQPATEPYDDSAESRMTGAVCALILAATVVAVLVKAFW